MSDRMIVINDTEQVKSRSQISFPSFSDILPDPPDGTPVIESITGKTITLSWKKPRRLDPSIGIDIQNRFNHQIK